MGLSYLQLARRERQLMEAIYRLGEGTVADVLGQLPDAPSYSAVRAMLRILEEKGHLKHRQQGARYVYLPTRSREQDGRSALKHLLQTFFDGSAEHAVAALLELSDQTLSETELARIARLIEQARKEGT